MNCDVPATLHESPQIKDEMSSHWPARASFVKLIESLSSEFDQMEKAMVSLAKENSLLRLQLQRPAVMVGEEDEVDMQQPDMSRGETEASHPRLDVQQPRRPEKFVVQDQEYTPIMCDDAPPPKLVMVNSTKMECCSCVAEEECAPVSHRSHPQLVMDTTEGCDIWWDQHPSEDDPLSGRDSFEGDEAAWFHFDLRAEWQMEDSAIERIKVMHRRKPVTAEDQANPLPGIFVPKTRRTSFTDVAEMYHFQGACARCNEFVMDPAGPRRTSWEFIGMLLILYDLIVIPLDAFDLPESLFTRGMNLLIVTYWTTDMILSFFTGYYMGTNLVTAPMFVVRRYLRTWFLFDCITVAPEWVSLVDVEGKASVLSSVSILRSLRVLRFLRLLRVLKMEGGYRKMQERINSNIALMVSGIIKLVLWLVTVNHFLGCFWYALGTATEDGWATQPEFVETTILYRYLTSVHWSLSQIHGEHLLKIHNTWERATAVLILFMALCLFSLFVSAITDLMFQLSQHTREKSTKMQALNNFFAEYRIEKELAQKAKQELEELIEVRECFRNDIALTEILPPRLMMDLHYEARSPILASYPLFDYLRVEYSSVLRQLCHSAARHVIARQSETIFHTGDACGRMLCVERGRLNYTRQWSITSQGLVENVDNDSVLRGGAVLCEAALWVKWENAGQLIADIDTRILAMDAALVGQVVREHSKAHAEVVCYARAYLDALQREEALSDMMDLRLSWSPWRPTNDVDLRADTSFVTDGGDTASWRRWAS